MDGRVEKHNASWLKKKMRKIRAHRVQIEQYKIQKHKLQKTEKKHIKDINCMKIEMNH